MATELPNANDAEKPGSLDQQREAVNALHSIAEAIRAAGEQSTREHRSNLLWQKGTTLAVAAYTALTVLLVVIGKCSLDESRRAFTSANRAWVAVTSASLTDSVAAGKPVEGSVWFQNVGRAPALDPAFRFSGGFHLPPRADVSLSQFSPGRNETCRGLIPERGAFTIFPNVVPTPGQIPGNSKPFIIKTTPDDPNAISEVLRSQRIIFFQGCVAYNTINLIGFTRFCLYLSPRSNLPSQRWVFRSCASGNSAE